MNNGEIVLVQGDIKMTVNCPDCWFQMSQELDIVTF